MVTGTADVVVIGAGAGAFGAWLPKLFPGLLGGWIKTPRRELFFIGAAPGDTRFDWRNCPNLTDALGWTSADIGGGVKIAPITAPADPPRQRRKTNAQILRQLAPRPTAGKRQPDSLFLKLFRKSLLLDHRVYLSSQGSSPLYRGKSALKLSLFGGIAELVHKRTLG
jgi:hypothetical protein